jgi:hypothetical protein
LLTACKHDSAEKPLETCSLPETVSFSQHIIPLFNAHCNTANCHSGSQPEGGLNLEASHAYAQLTQSGSGYIDTVTPRYSLLYAQMISVSTPMPPTGNLDKCSSDLILKWIEQKAPNN